MGLPPDGLQAWASRGRRGALGASGGIVDGNFSGAGGIRGDTEGRSEGTVPRDDRSRPLKGRSALGGSFVRWKKGRRGGRERMDWRGRTVGRGYSWGYRSEGQPPDFLLPGALGTFRPQERLSRRRRSRRGVVGKRLLPAPPAGPGVSRLSHFLRLALFLLL